MVRGSIRSPPTCGLFFFNDTATTEIYTLSLHDALPIFTLVETLLGRGYAVNVYDEIVEPDRLIGANRSEEHTSELQSRQYLVCRLLLEKKKHHVGLRRRHHQIGIAHVYNPVTPISRLPS